MLAARHACAVARLAPRARARAFHVSVPALAVTKTKKSYADLPSVHLRPDGTPAPPLEEWWAGDASRCTLFVRANEFIFNLFNWQRGSSSAAMSQF